MRFNLTLTQLLKIVALLLVVSISIFSIGIHRRIIENGKNTTEIKGVFPEMPLWDKAKFAHPQKYQSQFQKMILVLQIEKINYKSLIN
ncbi:hypothetical protein [Sphingobacterium sp.]|uniref:hypothetical protein n=1 Tax=Sphingobacterium sp. TaxID=341027 RepID=UPI0031D62523